MPKCDTCGFAHAQADRCINCGNPDPFRRHRIFKLAVLAASLVILAAAAFYLYQRYRVIERSVRQAELAAESQVPFVPVPPPRGEP